MNPSQKAGSYRPRRKRIAYRKNDGHVKRIARMEAKKVINGELESKTYDEELTAATSVDSATGYVASLCAGITRGTADNNFVGDVIDPTHLRIRMAINGNDSTNVIRVVLFQYKGGGGTPTLGTVFDGSVGFSYLSPYASNYSELFNILFDEMYTTVGNGTASNCAANSALLVDIRVPSKKLRKVHFTSSAALSSGDIWLIVASDSAAASHPTIKYSSRLYFKDA